MDFDLLGRIVTGVLAVSTFIAVALVGLTVGTVRTLRDSNNDLRARVEDLEKERTEDQAHLVQVQAEVGEVRSENRLLTSMVQGRVDWTAIQDQLEEHHRQALSYWSKTGKDIAGIRKVLEDQP